MLTWREAQPGSKLSAAIKQPRIADAGHQGGSGDGPDPLDSHQSLGWLALRGQPVDLPFIAGNALVLVTKLLHQLAKGEACQPRQSVLGVLQNIRKALAQLVNALGQHDAKFAQQAADLIGLCGARLNSERARPVQHQHRLLLLALDGDKAHAGPPDRFANRLRVVGVVLAALAVSGDELASHQAHLVPQLAQLPRPVVGTRAGFDSHQARRELRKELPHPRPCQRPAHHDLPLGVHPVYLEHILRDIQSDACNLVHDSLLSVIEFGPNSQSGTSDAAGEGGVHVITLTSRIAGTRVGAGVSAIFEAIM
ncbi:hypothetical protein D9M72_388550 [compost metagenome]